MKMVSRNNENNSDNNPLTPQFTIHASWSKAGIATCVVMDTVKSTGENCTDKKGTKKKKTKSKKLNRIAFDMGSSPIFAEAITASHVFISHAHIDHIGGIFSHARAHKLCYSKPATYYIPSALVPKVKRSLNAMIELDSVVVGYEDDGSNNESSQKELDKSHQDRSILDMNIVSVEPGEEIIFSKFGDKSTYGQLFMRSFEVDHRDHPTLGYVIGRRITKTKLKPEFKGIPGKKIAELVKSGVQIKETKEMEVLEVSYTGDTSINGLSFKNRNNQQQQQETISIGKKYLHQLFQANIILCELTFLDTNDGESNNNNTNKIKSSEDQARERGHIHVSDIKHVFSSENGFPSSSVHQKIVFLHLSNRYSPFYAMDQIVLKLPQHIIDHGFIAISSFIDSTCDELKDLVSQDGLVSLAEYCKVKSAEVSS